MKPCLFLPVLISAIAAMTCAEAHAQAFRLEVPTQAASASDNSCDGPGCHTTTSDCTDGTCTTAEYVVPETGSPCTSEACAIHQTLTITLPARTTPVEIRCYTNAGYPSDSEKPYQVLCGADVAWSIFSLPSVGGDSEMSKVISTVYSNRSHNRKRRVRLEVSYRPTDK